MAKKRMGRRRRRRRKKRMTTASSRIRGLHAVTRQLPRVKRVKTETWVCLIYKVFEKTEYIWSEEGLTED